MYCIQYEIKQGDSLYQISRRYNVPVNAIMIANPMINIYRLRVGDIICIPVSVPHNYKHYSTYSIQEGDTLGSILKQNNINLADLLQFNNLDQIYLVPGSTLHVPIVDRNNHNNSTL